MDNPLDVPQTNRRALRDWLDPVRLYDPRVPAGRLTFLWGLAIYPFAVMFVLMMIVITATMSFVSSAQLGDYLGIVVWVFMLAWVTAGVCIVRRRLLQLGKSPLWVWVAIVPVINVILFGYLLLKGARQPAMEKQQ